MYGKVSEGLARMDFGLEKINNWIIKIKNGWQGRIINYGWE